MSRIRFFLSLIAGLTLAFPIATRAGLQADYYCNYSVTGGIITPDPSSFSFTRVDANIDNWNAPSCTYRWNPIPACTDHYAVQWTGRIRIDVAGDYSFGTMSDDGSQVWVDGVRIVNNEEAQWWDWEDSILEGSYTGLYPENFGAPDSLPGPLSLSVGYHDLEVRMFEAGVFDGIELWWLKPGSGPSNIPYYGTHCAMGGFTVNAGTNWEIVPADVLVLSGTDSPIPSRSMPLSLESPRPNPFAAGTVVAFTIADAADVDLAVHDAAGRRVFTLATGVHARGRHEISWRGVDDAGRLLAAGVYFCRLQMGGEEVLQKMTLIR